MSDIYLSIFANEISSYLKLLINTGRYVGKIRSSLKSLDKYLATIKWSSNTLTADILTAWLAGKNAKARTKAKILSDIKGFAKHLSSLGIEACLPEPPHVPLDYTPYVFSEEELARIIEVADNFQASRRFTRTSLLFPVLLRILLGCGLRLGEGLSLRWADVDLGNGIITIRSAKNQKQRVVPISPSIQCMLKRYKCMVQSEGICHDYLFESHCDNAKPYRNCAFEVWFAKTLVKANISYAKTAPHERGPCPHCLRHSFVFYSLLKAESEGRPFTEALPFLSVYLGHENLLGTDKYLCSDYTLYTKSHRKVGEFTNDLFPEVVFE